MFRGPGLLVSLPGAEIGWTDLPGSLFEPRALSRAAISSELRSALRLVADEARRRGVELRCLARPELFINDMAASWLRGQAGAITEHLCISDGVSIKLLPGYRTHVFFYRRSRPDDLRALARAGVRAPEALARVAGQVNSHFSLGGGFARTRPPALFLGAATPLDQPRSTLLPFFLNRHSAEDSAHRIARKGPVAPESLAGFATLRYVPLTETAMADRGFARAVADMVLRACLDPATLLILRLPSRGEGDQGLVEAIAAILPALRDCGLVIPRAAPPNIFFAAGDLEESHPLLAQYPTQLVVHETFDFWRHTTDFYASAERVTVLTGADPMLGDGFLPCDVAEIYGARAVRRGIGWWERAAG